MAENKSRVPKVIGKAFLFILAALAAALTALVAYIMVCSVNGKAAEVFGISVMKVVSGSMEPSIHEGDYIIVRKIDCSELREGDIICFYSTDSAIYGMPNTHRILRVLEDGSFITKGDANSAEDNNPVSPDSVIGKYTGKSGFLRWINSFASVKKLIFLAVIVLVAVVAFYEVRTIAKVSSECRAEKAQRKNEEKERLIRQAIDREKQRLYESGYDPAAEEKNHEDEFMGGGEQK